MLRELGNKIKKLEKLGPEEDILFNIHEAVEALQTKIDHKSYLLVNSEDWEIGDSQNQTGQTLDHLMEDHETSIPEVKSVSDLAALHCSASLEGETLNSPNNHKKQASLPASMLSNVGGDGQKEQNKEHESRTYESASILSLATFSSLLIEFVARLQNLVDAFKELSEKANFKEPEVAAPVS